VRGEAGKWIVGLLLAAAIGAQLVELSGHWDLTLSDAGDEAALVAVVLCVGVAFATAAALKARMRPAHAASRIAHPCRHRELSSPGRPVSVRIGSPPAQLRI